MTVETEKYFEEVEVACNYPTWEEAAEASEGDVIYIRTFEQAGGTVSLNEAKDLIKYLENAVNNLVALKKKK